MNKILRLSSLLKKKKFLKYETSKSLKDYYSRDQKKQQKLQRTSERSVTFVITHNLVFDDNDYRSLQTSWTPRHNSGKTTEPSYVYRPK